ncbi:transcriptional regulator, HxlR family [Rivularia sp. IAM M-261]|nr:transcriptional regulator, HxlR family [Rivularia sp. IAM M-261]
MSGESKVNISSNVLDNHPFLRQTLELVADKWVVAVLYVLSKGTKRYGELQREIGNISQRMLTKSLRDLERNGLVSRKVYPVVPPIVEYSLTPLGESLNEVLKSLCDWSNQNFDAVEAARDKYDKQTLCS